MIRPFNLRDLALVRRLSERGVSLYTEPALTDNVQPLRGALLSIVGGDYPTYVFKTKGIGAGFIQLSLEKEDHHAHILCLGTSEGKATGPAFDNNGGSGVNESAWLTLLEQAVVDIGRRGIHSLVAEVDENGDELPVLRRAGFAVYTRQDVWAIKRTESKTQSCILAARKAADDWEIQLLYANTVPRLVQLVEPMPQLISGESWVLREGGELSAFVEIHTGAMASWMRLFIHPNAEAQAAEIISAALDVASRKASHTVYCCVRRYQSWLHGPMESTGFSLWGSQAVMVKHTVHHLRRPVPEMAAALDGQGVPVSAPIVPRYQVPKNGS